MDSAPAVDHHSPRATGAAHCASVVRRRRRVGVGTGAMRRQLVYS